MSSQEKENEKPALSFKQITLALKGGVKTGLTKEFAKPQIADFEDKAEAPAPQPRTFKTGESKMLKVRVTLEASKPVGTRREFELLRMRHRLPATDPKHISDAELSKLVREQMQAAVQRWEMQKANRSFSQVEYNNTRQQIYSFTVAQPPHRRIEWIEYALETGVINEVEFDMSLSRAMHDAREKWVAEDKEHKGNALERRLTRRAMESILDAIGEERSQAIIEKSKH